ncbi:hypothetical protein ACT29H_09115 [Thermophagus sp. OGC60D27]|uniref:hypothetical protein n=1 Tax=Thermophagus sp. OGC60D27 TaxID=3458415 RepID=UPI004037D923
MKTLSNNLGRSFLTLFTLYSLLCIFEGCGTKKEKRSDLSMNEGIVNYTISYPSTTKEKPFSFLLPDKMIYYFRPGQERISFKGNMGLYQLDFISNHSTDSTITLLKIINKKVFVPSSESRKLFIFQSLKNGTLTFDSDTSRTILGYPTQKAMIHLNNRINTDIEVWYCPQIANATTNKNTPFSQIPGVMLEYSIYFNELLFSLNSSQIEKKNLSDSLFKVPADYQPTTIKEIEQIISGILH